MCVHHKRTHLPLPQLLSKLEERKAEDGQSLDAKVAERALDKLLSMLSEKGMNISKKDLAAHILATKEPRDGALFFSHKLPKGL